MSGKSMAKTLCRRGFVMRAVPVCAALALSPKHLMAMTLSGDEIVSESPSHKFLADSEMTFEAVYRFRFSHYARLMKLLRDEIGQGKFMEMLQNAAAKLGAEYGKSQAESVENNDLASYIAIPEESKRFWEHVCTEEVIESSEFRHEVRITECLWAKTFRDADAADIGYASICHPDFAMTEGYNPKLKLVRTKTLMQGDDCCNHCWVMED